MKTTKEMIEVMQAYVNDKQIEITEKGKDKWIEIGECGWDWMNYDYRIKPEPKKRSIRTDELPYVFSVKYPDGTQYGCHRDFFGPRINHIIKEGATWTTDGKFFQSFEVEE